MSRVRKRAVLGQARRAGVMEADDDGLDAALAQRGQGSRSSCHVLPANAVEGIREVLAVLQVDDGIAQASEAVGLRQIDVELPPVSELRRPDLKRVFVHVSCATAASGKV